MRSYTMPPPGHIAYMNNKLTKLRDANANDDNTNTITKSRKSIALNMYVTLIVSRTTSTKLPLYKFTAVTSHVSS